MPRIPLKGSHNKFPGLSHIVELELMVPQVRHQFLHLPIFQAVEFRARGHAPKAAMEVLHQVGTKCLKA